MRAGSLAIVGGSIAGCAAAVAAVRAGVERVEVFERSGGRLEEWGMGLGVNQDRYAELAAAGYLDDATPCVRFARRRWIVRSGDEPLGRELAVQDFPFRGYTWNILWRALRRAVPPAAVYHPGATVHSVADTGGQVELTLDDGSTKAFDTALGADGYRSTVRAAMFPQSRPQYAKYVLWRGTFPASELPTDLDWDPSDAMTIVFPHGHAVAYHIPSAEGTGETTTVNWAVYAVPPAGADISPETPTSIPPGRMTDVLLDHLRELMEDHVPPRWAEAFRRYGDGVYVQPLYDLASPQYASGRLALLGDAATIARPHTGAGAVKALQDAHALEAALRDTPTLPQALHRYDAERRPVGHAMVALGRRLGRAQVEDVPDWSRMDPGAFAAWWHEVAEAPGGFGGLTLSP